MRHSGTEAECQHEPAESGVGDAEATHAPAAQFNADVAAGALPALSYIWHDSPLDEHPPANVTLGMNAAWQAVDAVVRAGLWNDTVFLLTWDDWRG